MSRSQTQKQLCRASVHESAHWAFAEYLGLGNPEGISVIPDSASKGRVSLRPPLLVTPEVQRNYLLTLVAGRVAENIITGTRRWVDGTDFIKSCELAHELGCEHPFDAAITVASDIIRGALWVPIVTCASVLFESRHITKEAARDIWWSVQPEPSPWVITRI